MQVDEGNECGVGCTNFSSWQEGDRLEFYELQEKTLSLEESKAKGLDFEETKEFFLHEFREQMQEEDELRDEGKWE